MTEISQRHSWLAAFGEDPDKGLSDLLSGYAPISPYNELDASEAARMLFGPLPSNDELITALDYAIQRWLEVRRRQAVTSNSMHPARSLGEISEALRIIEVLSLKHSITDLRARFLLWNSWFEHLFTYSEAVDARAVFLNTLALTQRRALRFINSLEAFSLEPVWLEVCGSSGSKYPANYLSLGLLGLRFLPERDGVPNEYPWMAGLAYWSWAQRPSVKDFSEQWLALKSLYPRAAKHWRGLVKNLLQQTSGFTSQIRISEALPSEIVLYWSENIGLTAQTQETVNNDHPSTKLSPASERISLMKRLEEPLNTLTSSINRLIRNREQYAIESGDSYYLVSTACSIGMGLIKSDGDLANRGALAAELALKALAWNPYHVFAWALWRDALAAQGQYEAAEYVGWETIRRFPDNVQWRNQLSELLIAVGRQEDAYLVVRETIARDLSDGATLDLNARLTFHFHGPVAAASALNEALKKIPESATLQHHKSRLEREGKLPLVVASFATRTGEKKVALAESYLSTAIQNGGKLKKLAALFRVKSEDQNWRRAAVAEVQEILAEDQHIADAHHLLAQLEGHTIESGGIKNTGFSLAFADAIARKDPDRFKMLEIEHRGNEPLIDLATAFLFGNTVAAEKIVQWLHADRRAEIRPVLTLREFMMFRLRFIQKANEPLTAETILKLVASNDNIKQDILEAAFVPTCMMLAA